MCVSIYIHIDIHIHTSIYIYIYIALDSDSDRARRAHLAPQGRPGAVWPARQFHWDRAPL